MSKLKEYFLWEIAKSQTGPFGSQLHESDYVENGTPIVTVEHLGIEEFILENLPKDSNEDKERLSKYILREGDIVFSRVGSIDRCTYVSKNEDGWMFSGRCICVRANSKVNPRYLNFYFRQEHFKKMMLNISVGATMPSLNTKLMDGIKVYLPDLKIQNNSSSLLANIDEKIKLNNRINRELEQMAKLLYDYWFVQFDFPDANGKPYKSNGGKMIWNKELKREIPEGWEVRKLKEFADTGSGGTPLKSKDEFYQNGNIPWINSGEVNAPFIISANKFITAEGLKNSSAKIFKRGTILMAMYGATAGQVSFIDIEACTNQAICAINPHKSYFSTFLKFGLEDLYRYLINLSTGSARDNLSQDKIQDLKFLIPDKRLVKKFDKVVSSLFKKILTNMVENHHLTTLRDWLLPMLMNGQVRVGEAGKKEYQPDEAEMDLAAEPGD